MKYDYKCDACGYEAEEVHPMTQDALSGCPCCEQQSYRKVISANPFMLLGEGWESHEKSGRYHVKGGT